MAMLVRAPRVIDRVRTQFVLRALGEQPDELLRDLAAQYAVLIPLVEGVEADWVPRDWTEAGIRAAFEAFVEADGAIYDELTIAYAQAVRPLE